MNKLVKSVKIGDVTLPSNLILAPMAGFSDLAFRELCRSFGAGLVCTEMVSSKALLYGNKKTEDLLLCLPETRPVAVQIFGHEPEVMAQAVKNPLLEKFDIIDINMGCPAPKIVKNGDGSALLKDFENAKKIIEACVKATKKPVTVKFRIGFQNDNIVAVEFAKMCEQAGAAAITVHGRTTAQGYSGSANHEVIRLVKNAVKIPVFANGDCRSLESFENIMTVSGADGVMIGRAALGYPEIFSEIANEKPIEANKLDQIKFHYETLLKFFSEKFVVLNMRAHLARYLSKKNKNSEVLVKLLKCTSYAEILQILSDFYQITSKI